MCSDYVECTLPAFDMFTFTLMMLYCFELNDVSILQYLEGSNSSSQYGLSGTRADSGVDQGPMLGPDCQ